jgi:hypothetical protein
MTVKIIDASQARSINKYLNTKDCENSKLLIVIYMQQDANDSKNYRCQSGKKH